MAITRIDIAPCVTGYGASQPSFEVTVTYEQVTDLQNKGIAIWLEEDGEHLDLIYHSPIDLLPEKQTIVLNDTSVFDQLDTIVKKGGFKEYKLYAVYTEPANAIRSSPTENLVVFTDVVPTIESVKQNKENVQIIVDYYSSKVNYYLYNLTHDKKFPFSFVYNEEENHWQGNSTFDTSIGECNESLEVTLVEKYDALSSCIIASETSQKLENVTGACMTQTKWSPLGSDLLFDSEFPDFVDGAISTDKSSHWISFFSYPKNAQYTIFARMRSAEGKTYAVREIPIKNSRTQRDISSTAITGTDKWASVWRSNDGTIDFKYNIYLAAFEANLRPQPGWNNVSGEEINISTGRNNCVCPRIVYNPASGVLLVTWVNIEDKKLVGIYYKLGDDNQFKQVSYAFDISREISLSYYVGLDLDLNSSYENNVVLMVDGDTVIVGYQKTQEDIYFSRVSAPGANGQVTVTPLTTHRLPTVGPHKFHATIDVSSDASGTENKRILMVYSSYLRVYGVCLQLFGTRTSMVYPDTQLNVDIVNLCFCPNIKSIDNGVGGKNYVVAWGTEYNIVYNTFDSDFISVGKETIFNVGSYNRHPTVVSSESQVGITFQSIGGLPGPITLGTAIYTHTFNYNTSAT
jgi:hypothetical protein